MTLLVNETILPNSILRTEAAAEYVGLSISTLAHLRVKGGGPTFVKIGRRCVGYLRTDLDEWLRSRRKTSTSM